MERWYLGDFVSLLLDSSHITRVRFSKHSFKVIKCGDYIQLYSYTSSKLKQDVEKLDVDNLSKKSRVVNKDKKKIEERSIIRTKLSCQRLAKANAKDWKTFITLTYAENMQDVAKSKKDLTNFIHNIKKVKRDFKYIAIPEFQKRGAIHFHLLTNLSLQDNNIIKKQKDNDKYYDVKYWAKGFTSVEVMTNDVKKIVGYISKYMTKDNCDERLFNFKRYTSSQNLIKPEIEYISMRDKKSRMWLANQLRNKSCIYEDDYLDVFNENVNFKEFL